jgi:DNA recombination protein RmuC
MSEPSLIALLCLIAGLAAGGLIAFVMRPKAPAIDPVAEAQKLAEAQRNAESLSNLNTRLDDMAKWLHGAHGQLKQTMDTRLDAVTARLGETLTTSTNTTAEHLQNLHARLAVIDSAQKNITDLATTVTTLQKVFDNKQRRGAFGQGRMEAIIGDALPKDGYEFQATLSNGKRPDCCIRMPDSRPLVIDAKFPLEAASALERATNDDERAEAARLFRTSLGTHIADIAKKYLIPGETQDFALMFVPSESLYTELHDNFDDVVQKAFRAHVMIVSPSLLMLAISVVQQIRKDAKMREAADRIHDEVGHLMNDIGRLRERVAKLGTHFNQANEDVRQIMISAEKVEKRGERIRNVEFGEDDATPALPGAAPRIEAAE